MKKIIDKFVSGFFGNRLRPAFLFWVAIMVIVPFKFYFEEIEKIRGKSLSGFDVDVSNHFSFFEILNSAGYSFWRALLFSGIWVFLPVAIISRWGLKYREESHAGWRRIFVSIQLGLPIVLTVFASGTGQSDWVGVIFVFLAFTSCAVLLVNLIRWIMVGFKSEESNKYNELK